VIVILVGCFCYWLMYIISVDLTWFWGRNFGLWNRLYLLL